MTQKKTGDLVRESLVKKHPDERDVSTVDLPTFEPALEFTGMQSTYNKVEKVAKHVSGTSRPSDPYSLSLSY